MIQEELIRSLQSQIDELETKLARMTNAHLVLSIERDVMSRKLYGLNTHPDAVAHLREALQVMPVSCAITHHMRCDSGYLAA